MEKSGEGRGREEGEGRGGEGGGGMRCGLAWGSVCVHRTSQSVLFQPNTLADYLEIVKACKSLRVCFAFDADLEICD